MDLIKVEKQTIGNDEVNAVDARELHRFLELKEHFNEWINRYLKEYDFVINSDFYRSKCMAVNGREMETYVLTLDMAKEISMISKTKQGKKARKYFIECEKKLKASTPTTYISALKALVVAEEKKEQLLLELKQAQPAIDFTEVVTKSAESLRIGEYAKILSDAMGVKIGSNKLMRYFREKGYLMHGRDALEKNKPYQSAIDAGLFEFKIERPQPHIIVNVTYITGNGQFDLKDEVLNRFC